MAPLAYSTSCMGDQGVSISNPTLHSPPRSPRRPTMGILKSKATPQTESTPSKKGPKHQELSLLNEVRESLLMPKFGTYNDDSEVCDDDTEDGENTFPIPMKRSRMPSQNVNAIILKSQRNSPPSKSKVSSRPVTQEQALPFRSKASSRPAPQEQAPEPKKKLVRNIVDSDDRSYGAVSTKSTKSTRTINSFFRRWKPTVNTAGDDVSVAASTKSGWWKRSSTLKESNDVATTASLKKGSDNIGRNGSQSIQSYRVKKPEKTSIRGAVNNNDQLVADFFDVQSFISEPDFVGSSRLRKTEVNQKQKRGHGGVAAKKDRLLETSSVVSNRSQRSNVFSKFFQRMRAINDEVLDIDDAITPDLTGTDMLLNVDETGSIVDDELTLCSGFDNFSHMDSVQDDYDDDDQSQLSTESHQSNASNGSDDTYENARRKAEMLSRKATDIVPETPFIQKIMQRRIMKNESTVLRDVVGLGNLPNGGPEPDNNGKIQQKVQSPIKDKAKLSTQGGFASPSPQRQQRLISPGNRNKRVSPHLNLESPTQRAKALAQCGMKLQSSKSLSHLPSCIEPVVEDASSPAPPPTVTRGLCRWDSDLSLNTNPSAPKRPSRGGGQGRVNDDPQLSTPSPSARLSPKRNLDKLIKQSQSMRNLSSPYESKTNSDEDDDEDSVLSLLSGLLATWSAERDGINITVTQRLTSTIGSGGLNLKSILKLPTHDNEEQKIDSRERYSVRFKTIEVREYERIVGDNPSCSKGPPISIGWGYFVHRHYSINDYEHLVRGPRRTKKEFHLAADRRTHLLINEWKCSEEDIRKARREATYIQYCRAKTAFSGSRAAAKEAAFLRKANDQSKILVPSKQIPINMSGTNDASASLPKTPSRRKAIEISPTPQPNRPIPSTPTKVVSASFRQKLLEV